MNNDYEFFSHYALLFSEKCKICGGTFVREKSWRVLGPPFVFPGRVATSYYICGVCSSYGAEGTIDISKELNKAIRGRRPNAPPPPHGPVELQNDRIDGVLSERMKRWENSNSLVVGEVVSTQAVNNVGLDYKKRTLLLSLEFGQEIDDLLKKIPDGKVRAQTVDGTLVAIYFHREDEQCCSD